MTPSGEQRKISILTCLQEMNIKTNKNTGRSIYQCPSTIKRVTTLHIMTYTGQPCRPPPHKINKKTDISVPAL